VSAHTQAWVLVCLCVLLCAHACVRERKLEREMVRDTVCARENECVCAR